MRSTLRELLRWTTPMLAGAVALTWTAFAGPASPDAANDAGSQVVLRVPDMGLIYVRYGEPGGVFIHSMHRVPRPDSTETDSLPLRTVLTRAEIARIVADEMRRYRRGTPAAGGGGTSPAAPVPARDRPAPVGSPRSLAPPSLPADMAGSEPAPGEAVRWPAAEAAAVVPEESPEETRAFIRREFRYRGLLRTQSVVFKTDRSELLPYADAILSAVGDVMLEFPQMRLRIEGHADLRGSSEHNLSLSQRRAEAVLRYLVDAKGVSAERLEAAGYGETRPLVSGADMTALTLNRRVEFRVLNPEEVFPADSAR